MILAVLPILLNQGDENEEEMESSHRGIVQEVRQKKNGSQMRKMLWRKIPSSQKPEISRLKSNCMDRFFPYFNNTRRIPLRQHTLTVLTVEFDRILKEHSKTTQLYVCHWLTLLRVDLDCKSGVLPVH